jgi:hypothetical protein
MLSDIEELESVAESTPRRNSAADLQTKSERNSMPLGSSPTVPDEQPKPVAPDFGGRRRLSLSDSNGSDIDLAGYAAEFEGFTDDGMSENNYAEDDEDIMEGNTYKPTLRTIRHNRKSEDAFSEDGEDKHSSIALSRRAEIILANAKRRLTVSMLCHFLPFFFLKKKKKKPK